MVLAAVVSALGPAHDALVLQAREYRRQGSLAHPHPCCQIDLREPFLLPQPAQHRPFRHADAIRQQAIRKPGHKRPMGLADKKTQATVGQNLRFDGA